LLKTYQIELQGQVQGVGFRPTVYQLATRYSLNGTVSNNEKGVIIRLTGPQQVIHDFYEDLLQNPPKLSVITSGTIKEIGLIEFPDFKIVPSSIGGVLNLQLTPDFGICTNCAAEIRNSSNRRFGYPFTTCIHCGPRWSITRTFPFERGHTSMRDFTMCPSCSKEYTDPTDRRFHSQTNSCANCGVSYRLIDGDGRTVTSAEQVFSHMASLLREGAIIAIKNNSGYLLCCDASNKESILELRTRKQRPAKPFAVLYPSLRSISRDFVLSTTEAEALSSPQRPIVLLSFSSGQLRANLESIAPGLNQLGVMLPNSAIFELLSIEFNAPLIATSGNIHGSPVIRSTDAALSKLSEVADYFFDHNLEISYPQDDSVVRLTPKTQTPVILRRSRGFAPSYLQAFQGNSSEKLIALGSHLKSSIAIIPNNFLYVSQYIGNLDSYEVLGRFSSICESIFSLFDLSPSVVLVDKHPAYHSAQYGKELAAEREARLLAVQHHKAHFAAVLGEQQLFKNESRVLGVIWDGTGYGEDGQIWGGEFFSYEHGNISRLTHFEYFDWLAADKMAREPRLSLLSILGEEEIVTSKFTPEQLAIYRTLKKNNKLKTSSVGRLVDAVASLLGVCDISSYEAEAAMQLEALASNYELDNCLSYFTGVTGDKVPVKQLLKSIYQDYRLGSTKESIAANFFFTLAGIIFQYAAHFNFKELAFSGGLFQNAVLVDMIKQQAPKDYKLYFHLNLSPNDENISFGQLMYYLNCK
jgi:hydrogenase maturation protein HypF